MPIYEYECSNCGHQTEILQTFSDTPLKECKRCHGKMKKIISQNTFHLKGTGWYVTDYASKTSQNQKSAEKSDQNTSDSKKSKETSDTASTD